MNEKTNQTGLEGKINKTKIIGLVHKVNASKRRVREGLLPLTFTDEGWRLVFPKALEFYGFLSSGRRLMELAVYDYDMAGGYYWIPYASPPRGVMTPAMRLALVGGEE